MHVLNLVAGRGIKESIAEGNGSSVLEVIHQSFVMIRSDWKRSPEVSRKVFPETRGLATEERFNTFFGKSSFTVYSLATSLRLCRTGRRNVYVSVGGVDVVCRWTT